MTLVHDLEKKPRYELRTYGISWGETEYKAQDLRGWKAVVKALCFRRDEEDLVSYKFIIDDWDDAGDDGSDAVLIATSYH